MFNKIVSTVGSRMLIAVINFVLLIVTTQLLGVEGSGEASLFLLDVTLVVNFNSFVGGPSLIYLVPRYSTSQLLSVAYVWSVASSIGITLFLYYSALAPPEWLWHVLGVGWIYSLVSIHLMVLLGKDRVHAHNTVSLVMTVGKVIFLVAWVYGTNDHTVWAYINSLYLSQAIAVLWSLALLIRHFGPLQFTGFSSALRAIGTYGFYNQLASLAQLLNFRLGYYILEKWVANGVYLVGIYSTGVKLAEALWLVSRSISLVQYAAISNMKDQERSQNLTVSLAKLNVIGTFCLLIPALLIPSEVYSQLFGDKDFAQVKQVLLYLSPGILVFAGAGAFSHYFAGVGQLHINTIASGIGLLVTVGLGFVLIPLMGWQGAALTTIASYAATGGFLLILFMRQAKVKPWIFIPTKKDFQQMITIIRNKITREKPN